MRKIVLLTLTILVGSRLYAQDIVVSGDVKYTTELQYDFKKSCNWVNLLDLNVQLSTEAIGMWTNGFLDMELISIYRTAEERIFDDKQVFSNIDEENQWLRIFTLGYTHVIKKANLFLGLRNVNRDYFTTAYTSIFVNSSCGIYPTISANYPVANYPLAAMCLHAEYEVDHNWSIKSSLYNGTAYESVKQAFTINPKRDGLFNMTQISYTRNSNNYGTYNLGATIHSGMSVCNENGESQCNAKKTSQKKTKVDYSFWANIEQCIYSGNGREIGVLAQGSFAPPGINRCSQYYGVGLHISGWTTSSRNDQVGVFINRAKFDNEKEVSLEVTGKYPIRNKVELQPAFHLIENRGNIKVAGILRLSYTLHFP